MPTIPFRTSTPTLPDEDTEDVSSLSRRESALKISDTTQTQIRELVSVPDVSRETSVASFLQYDDDASSSTFDVPSLPGGVSKVRFVKESREQHKTGDDSSQVSCLVLYGAIPGIPDSETDVGDETMTRDRSDRQLRVSGATNQLKEITLSELSARSRAILKQFFEKADPYTFPIGHRTVAFTEPHVYHFCVH